MILLIGAALVFAVICVIMVSVFFLPILLIGAALVFAVICVIIVSIFCDADLTTLLYEKYGRNVGEELRGKVVWITGASSGKNTRKSVLQ